MKSWKTTLAGVITGGGFIIDAVMDAAQAGTFNGKHGKELALGIVLVIWGAIQKDHNVTGSGAK
jgi:hypothetical protein